MSRRASGPPPVPALNQRAGASVAEAVMEWLGDGLDVPAEVVAAAEEWQSGQFASAWAVLYRWGASHLDGHDAAILAGLR